MKTCVSSEVYDNPNYSHIIIGGKPFFILPTGELSEHVPVPSEGEQLTPRHLQGQGSASAVAVGVPGGGGNHIYEGGGSSTYRSGSDYETESSTYRPDSDRASNGGGGCGGGNGFPPIYEEIDKNTMSNNPDGVRMNQHYTESQFGGTPQHIIGLPVSDNKGFVRAMAVNRAEDNLPPHPSLHSESWTSKSLSPRRPPSTGRMPTRSADSNNSVYYYSDTLRRRPGTESGFLGGRDSVQESDSGVSSGRSGHNTSSESTPQPRFELNRSLRGGGGAPGGGVVVPPAVRANYPVVVSSEEDISLDLTTSAVAMRRLPPDKKVLAGVAGGANSSNSPVRRQLPTPEHFGGRSRLQQHHQQHQQMQPAMNANGRGMLQQAHPAMSGSAPTSIGLPTPIDTEIVVRNTSRREPRAHL